MSSRPTPAESIELDDTLPFFRPAEPPPMPLDRFVEWSVLEQEDPLGAQAFLRRSGYVAPNAARRALGYWQHRIRTDEAFCERFRAIRDFYVNTRAALGGKPEGARR